MDRKKEQELAAMFERELQGVARAWRERGIDTRGIVSGSTAATTKVAGWINAPGSRKRFDEVIQKLGRPWTVEEKVLSEKFRPLFVGWYGVLEKSEGRLSGQVAD